MSQTTADGHQKSPWRLTDYLAIISPIAMAMGFLLSYQSNATRTEINITYMTAQIKDMRDSLDRMSIKMEASNAASETRIRAIEMANVSQQGNLDTLNKTFSEIAGQNRAVLIELMRFLNANAKTAGHDLTVR